MKKTLYDKIGQEIKVGDLVLACDSFNTRLIFGTVSKLCPKMVKFNVHESRGQICFKQGWPGKPRVNWISQQRADKVVVISEQTVKNYAWKMLKEA